MSIDTLTSGINPETSGEIETLRGVLQTLLPVVATQAAHIEIGHIGWLTTCPYGDINFKNHLKDANHVATLHYSLALLPLFTPAKGPREAINRRIRAIERAVKKWPPK